jgi:hypothetical protein
MAAQPGGPGSGGDATGPGPVPPEALPKAWRPLLMRPALAGLLGDPLGGAALTEMCRLLPTRMALHSLRVFLLADACAQTEGTRHDRAGLLAAAAFHDTGLVGWTPLRRGGHPRRSAELLDRFLAGRRVDDARRAVLTRAVREHMRPFPARDAGPEVRLLHFAAWLDVTGRGERRLPGERRMITAPAPTPLFAVTFSARVVACGLRRVLPDPAAAAR